MEEERREKETHETEAATSDSCHSRMKRPLHTEGAPVGLLRWQEAAFQEVREMKNGCTAETEHEQEATWRKNSLRRSRKRSKKWMNAPVFPTCKEKRSVRSKTMGTHTEHNLRLCSEENPTDVRLGWGGISGHRVGVVPGFASGKARNDLRVLAAKGSGHSPPAGKFQVAAQMLHPAKFTITTSPSEVHK